MAISEDSPIPTEMKRGQGALIVVDTFITEPMGVLTLTAAQPLGFTVK